MPRSRSAIHESSTSDDDQKNNTFQKRFVPLSNNQRLSKQNSFLFKSKINGNNNNENDRSVLEEIDIDVDELINADEPSASIVYFPSSYTNPISNIINDANR
jgi:hypothetical protein